tara:strand:- start:230 stop:1441 length:1212 start_codon:yes stop_codon:yes gene_type:complete
MKILIYGINYSPELTGIGKYSGEMGAWLASRGHEVRAVTAPPYYPDWEIQTPYKNRYATEQLDGVRVVRCPLYVPESVSTSKRILHLASFALSSLPRLLAQTFWKPDVVICVVPSMFCVPVSWLLARLAGAKHVVHVQDFEVDAMLGLNMSGKGIVSKAARWFEHVCLRCADILSTISNSMVNRAIAKGVASSRTLLFPNWAEVDRFLNVSETARSELRDRLGLSADKKLCLYSGNIGEKQGLENVLLAADAMRNESVEFLLVGQGAGLGFLKQRAKELDLPNVRFLPLQPWEDLPALLGLADCHLVIQRKGVADAVLPSKLTNILAVGGQALITAEQGTELANLCAEYSGIAELVEPEDMGQLIAAIKVVIAKQGFNEIAQEYARNNLDKESVLRAFELALQ